MFFGMAKKVQKILKPVPFLRIAAFPLLVKERRGGKTSEKSEKGLEGLLRDCCRLLGAQPGEKF